MEFKRVVIQNFKGIENMELTFFPGVNLILGENGVGKTSVLEAMTIAFGDFFNGIAGVNKRGILHEDIHFRTSLTGDASTKIEYCTPTTVRSEIHLDKATVTGEVTRRDETSQSRTKYLGKECALYARKICNDMHSILPLLCYFSTSRMAQSKREDFGTASKNKLQLADLISGTLSYVFDRHKRADDTPAYLEILKEKTIRIEMYPKTYDTYILENSAIAEDYDEEIAKLCFAQAVKFIERNADEHDPEIVAQVIVLQYLLFRFMNNDTRGYIYTQELKNQLANTELRGIKDQTFRMRIIGKLRDEGVIIASSQRGYKIPSRQAELYDFINHDAKIVIPMLARLKKCRDLVKLGTVNGIDLLAHPEYRQLQAFFDSLPVETDFEQ